MTSVCIRHFWVDPMAVGLTGVRVVLQ